MVNRVLYRSSAIVDAKEVCRIARERGALSFVDDYHGVGIVPLDVHDLGCDFYTAGVLSGCAGARARVPLRAAGVAPVARADGDRVVRDGGAFSFDTQHSSTTRPPGASSTARRPHRCSSSRRAGST